ncbi:MAG: hypothetical protein ACI93G_001223, partial [Hyphomonas sp.]
QTQSKSYRMILACVRPKPLWIWTLSMRRKASGKERSRTPQVLRTQTGTISGYPFSAYTASSLLGMSAKPSTPTERTGMILPTKSA